MEVHEINVKVYILQDITVEEALEALSKLIDKSFYKNKDLKNFHEENKMKNYCFNSLYPLNIKTKIYEKGCIYNFQLRCIGFKLRDHFLKFLANEYTSKLKVLICQSKNIYKKPIDRIYSITPLMVKMPGSEKIIYWRNGYTEDEFFEYIRTTSIKKIHLQYSQRDTPREGTSKIRGFNWGRFGQKLKIVQLYENRQ